ncbi:hypothetical protein G7Y89_g8554 [Cudoniella acicularis]|uniref:C2H2-type domain-containing protein n=1 Tax=Cudoniella acicularis TaxID=354080 RepID=A0A8H4W0Y7_9HELO|nr:hypothetical protein G7Y89_g8554 [Cudoniella acicularis]
MFREQNTPYNPTTGATPTSCPSLASSFSSSSDSPSFWEAGISTPVSTPRCSPTSPEDEYLSSSAVFYTPDQGGNVVDFCPISTVSQDMSACFQDQEMSFSENRGFPEGCLAGFDFDSLLTQAPSLNLDSCSSDSFAESSPTSADFVVPSQTTFDVFNMQSPLQQVNSMHIDLQYTPDEYMGEFVLSNSPGGSLKHYPLCPDHPYSDNSSPTTPIRPSSFRSPISEPLASSAALHQVQFKTEFKPEFKTEPDQNNESPTQNRRSSADCTQRKKIKREARDCILPNNIKYQRQAAKRCKFLGCDKKFQRSEHLKRHEKIHYDCEILPCPFCPKTFKNRADNLMSHMKIHAKPKKKAGRTDYFPEAAGYIAMVYSTKKRKGHNHEREKVGNEVKLKLEEGRARHYVPVEY